MQITSELYLYILTWYQSPHLNIDTISESEPYQNITKGIMSFMGNDNYEYLPTFLCATLPSLHTILLSHRIYSIVTCRPVGK
jgi:hypothetical protein